MTGLIFNEEIHRAGEMMSVSRHSVRQGLAWMIAADLVRRHPDVCRIVETHPHMYDNVTVFARDAASTDPHGWRVIVHLNKENLGHITPNHWFGSSDDDRLNWLDVLLSENLRTDIVEPLERAEQLPSPTTSPSTTSWSIGPRVLAAFAQKAMFVPRPFRLMNGMDDTDYGSSPRRPLFDQIPGLATRVSSHEREPFGAPEWRYWFIVETDDPTTQPSSVRLAVDTIDGVAFTKDSQTDLMDLYKTLNRDLDAVAAQICPSIF